MKPNSTWYSNSQRIRILMMSVISGHEQQRGLRYHLAPFAPACILTYRTSCPRLCSLMFATITKDIYIYIYIWTSTLFCYMYFLMQVLQLQHLDSSSLSFSIYPTQSVERNCLSLWKNLELWPVLSLFAGMYDMLRIIKFILKTSNLHTIV